MAVRFFEQPKVCREQTLLERVNEFYVIRLSQAYFLPSILFSRLLFVDEMGSSPTRTCRLGILIHSEVWYHQTSLFAPQKKKKKIAWPLITIRTSDGMVPTPLNSQRNELKAASDDHASSRKRMQMRAKRGESRWVGGVGV